MRKKLKPVHPGEVLREEYLAPLKLSMNKLALDLRVPATRIAEIVHERRGITPDTALRLGRYFNTTAQFWMNLQTTFDLEMAEDTRLQKINREVQPAPGLTAAAYDQHVTGGNFHEGAGLPSREVILLLAGCQLSRRGRFRRDRTG